MMPEKRPHVLAGAAAQEALDLKPSTNRASGAKSVELTLPTQSCLILQQELQRLGLRLRASLGETAVEFFDGLGVSSPPA